MDHNQRASLLDVVNRIQTENLRPESSEKHGQSPDSVEIPIDYSVSRKRRILDNFDEESQLNSAKKTLDYGSDSHSEDRSFPGSPSQNNQNLSSPEMDLPDQMIRRHPNLPEIPIFPSIRHPELHMNQHHPHAAALHLFLQVQQRKQQSELFQSMTANAIHNNGVQLATRLSRTPSPTIASQSTMLSLVTPKQESLPMTPPSSGDQQSSLEKDGAYWERRRKNNEAAKRSRDARRQKEQQIAIRAQLLEQENIHLKFELAQLRAENTQMREQLYILHVNRE